jgi:thiamine biosynthesis lipoprotein
MPRTVHVEHCMGTVFTIDVRDTSAPGGDWATAVSAAVTLLHDVDRVFSTYRSDSDISRLRRGELRLRDAHPDVRTVLDLCADVQLETHAAFSAMRGGRLDPTGLVKGWAIDRASALLRKHGSGNHAVNGGGDVLVAGEAAPGRPWGIGVVDPADRTRVLETVLARDLAVATSGTAERGAHIDDPATGRSATGLLSATVIGPSMTLADAYATAAFVMGRDAIEWIRDVPGYEVMLVTPDGTRMTSRGWTSATAEPSAA